VKEDADGKHQKSSAETDGQTKKEKWVVCSSSTKG
jgi:hypothetical protein